MALLPIKGIGQIATASIKMGAAGLTPLGVGSEEAYPKNMSAALSRKK